MKKILVICFLLIASIAFADTHTATKNGCWADTSVWDVSAVPENGDSVELAGYVVTAIGNGTTDCTSSPSAAIPSTGTLAAITSTGKAGQIQYKLDDDDCHGGCSLAATTVTAGTKPTTAGLIWITGVTTHVLSLTVGTGAGEGLIGGSNANAYGVFQQSTGTVNFVGNISASANSPGYATDAGAILNITGNISGSSGIALAGLYLAGTGTISINGTLTGGALRSPAVYNYGGADVTLSATSHLIYGTSSPPYDGKAPSWQPTTGKMKVYIGAGFGQAANTELGIGGSGGSYAY
jgi:hypothetical protein